MIKILIEGMTEGKGGKETYMINVFRAFDKSRFCFTFIAYDPGMVYRQELLENGAEVVDLPPRHKGLSAHRKALKELLEKGGFDVVWAHKTTLSACEIMELASSRKVPVRIIHSHSSSNMGGKFTLLMHTLNRKLIRKWANVYFACSETAAVWFYGDQSCQIMKNGIDLAKFRFDPSIRARIREEYRLGGCYVIGHVGRFGIEKNHRKLLHVFHEYRKTDPAALLFLCGDGEERDHIEELIRELGLTDAVRMPGVVDNVHEILQAVDLIVMPSLFEGLPFALLEAQAAGLACVVSDTVSAESDILGNNRFVSLNASDAVWAQTIREVSQEDYDRKQGYDVMKEQCYDIADSCHEIQEMIERRLQR